MTNQIFQLGTGSGCSNYMINDNHIKSIKNANDRDHIDGIVIKIWDRIADFFCNTNRVEAKKCLFDLFDKNTSVDQKKMSFEILRELASPGYKNIFRVSEFPEKTRYRIDLQKFDSIEIDINKNNQGSNSSVRVDGNRIIKEQKELGHELKYETQAKTWNEYYRGTSYESALFFEKTNELSLPFIEGRYPTDFEKMECLIEMKNSGFFMVDFSNKKNFIFDESSGKCFPVDFGQVYQDSDKFAVALRTKFDEAINKYEKGKSKNSLAYAEAKPNTAMRA